MKDYKRKHRTMPVETREKIRQSLKGRTLTEAHRMKISNGMKAYWKSIPE